MKQSGTTTVNTPSNDTPLRPLGGGERLLLTRDVLPLVGGMSGAALRDMVARGTFPKPIRVGTRRFAWPESAVRNWIAEREAAANV
jgi:prophage regulatory protein